MSEQKISLPTSKIKAARKSPKNFVLYGQPKIGKTTSLAQLDNCLIIDLEDGTDMIEALKIKAKNLSELGKIGKEIINAGKPYKYIAIDTVTQLEVWCESEAKKLYKNTPMGKNFDSKNEGLSVLSLPNGAGYLYLRQAYKLWIDRLNTLADHIILVGHLKEAKIDKKGKEVAVKDLDLTGKIKNITCANADAIGYVFREDDTTMISFDSMGDIQAGSRCEHLKGQTFPLEWDKIFID
jgi:hypothetical protein